MTSTAVETVSLSYKGGWWPWYNSCHRSNLNCLYLNGKVDPKGMDWVTGKTTTIASRSLR